MTLRISNIYKSLVRHTVDTVAAIQREGVSVELAYHDWDERGDATELPPHDLLGLAGWTFSENNGLWIIHCGLTISTVNDDNLLREVGIIDVIHDIWGEKCVIPLRDDTGEEVDQLVVEEFELMVSGQSERRNYRPIGLVIRRTSGG